MRPGLSLFQLSKNDEGVNEGGWKKGRKWLQNIASKRTFHFSWSQLEWNISEYSKLWLIARRLIDPNAY